MTGRAHCLVDDALLKRVRQSVGMRVIGEPTVFEQKTIYSIEVESDLLDPNGSRSQYIYINDGGWLEFALDDGH